MTYQRFPRYPEDDETFADELERIVTSADVPARATLAQDVLDRVAQEMPTSPPRRFVSAVIALDLSASVRNFRQTVSVASGGSRIPAIVRYQAIAVVMLMVSVVGTAGVLGAAATISIAEIIVPAKQNSNRASQKPPNRNPADAAPSVVSSNARADVGGPRNRRATSDRAGVTRGKGAAANGSAPRITIGVRAALGKPKAKPGATGKPPSAKIPPMIGKPAKAAKEPDKPSKPSKPSKPDKPDKPSKPDQGEASSKS